MVYHKNFDDKLSVSPAFSLDPEFELFSTRAWMLDYSPDGQQLALTHDGDSNLKIMNGDGANARQIFNSGGKTIAFPTWSPDGKSIVFGIGGVFERPVVPVQLELIGADGSNPHMLTDGKASSGFASWSPDGKRLVYRVMGDGQQGLRILSLDDGKITNSHQRVRHVSDVVAARRCYRVLQFPRRRLRHLHHAPGRLRSAQADRTVTGTTGIPSGRPTGIGFCSSSSRNGFKDEELLDEWGPQPYGDLYVMHADGTGARQLTDNQWEEATPAWRPEQGARSALSDSPATAGASLRRPD